MHNRPLVCILTLNAHTYADFRAESIRLYVDCVKSVREIDAEQAVVHDEQTVVLTNGNTYSLAVFAWRCIWISASAHAVNKAASRPSTAGSQRTETALSIDMAEN